jgi:uncharacterized membrane protein YkoI
MTTTTREATTMTTAAKPTTTTIRRAAAALVVIATLAIVLAIALRDDDRLVDPRRADARQAIAAAQAVVGGRLVDVRRDVDNGKWEVTLRDEGRDYEVELSPGDLQLLRIDYD